MKPDYLINITLPIRHSFYIEYFVVHKQQFKNISNDILNNVDLLQCEFHQIMRENLFRYVADELRIWLVMLMVDSKEGKGIQYNKLHL